MPISRVEQNVLKPFKLFSTYFFSFLQGQSDMSDALKKSKGYKFSSWDRERSGGACTSDTAWGDGEEDGEHFFS